jgi:hypothetical protein
VKAKLEHGQFSQWVEAEFPHGIRTAQRLMNEAERFGENYLHVAHLGQTTRYRLCAASTSDRLVRRVITASLRGKALDDEAVNDLIERERSANREGELVVAGPLPTRAAAKEWADDAGFDDESEHLSPAAKAAALVIGGLYGRDLRKIAEWLENSSPQDFFDAIRSEISRPVTPNDYAFTTRMQKSTASMPVTEAAPSSPNERHRGPPSSGHKRLRRPIRAILGQVGR